MGLSLSLLPWSWLEFMRNKAHGLAEQAENFTFQTINFSEKYIRMTLRLLHLEKSDSGIKITSNGSVLQESLTLENLERKEIEHQEPDNSRYEPTSSKISGDDVAPEIIPMKCLRAIVSPRPRSELDAAAVKLQKVYKSYRTRRNLADCAVVVEELWWKALDFASLKHSSISFFNVEKPETAISRWARALTRAAKVGKGLSKSSKAQKLALRHWLEAIDPRHRYGHNLHLYYDVWFDSESTQPFFYWLDIGDGKEVNLEKCPRSILQQQCIKYLGPKEREEYEVIVENGKLIYKLSEMLVDTDDGSKWIFVLSTTKALYVGQKIKGKFQHSSFLAGGATIAAGRFVAKEGMLKAVWPYSGHYLPTEENFKEFINFLVENNVNLTNVMRYTINDDECLSFKKRSNELTEEVGKVTEATEDFSMTDEAELSGDEEEVHPRELTKDELNGDSNSNQATSVEFSKSQSCKWTTGAGPRIGCVREYPTDLQCKALEQVNLSPRVIPSPRSMNPIPSPRPSPRVRLSPRLGYNMGIRTPTISLTLPPKPRKR